MASNNMLDVQQTNFEFSLNHIKLTSFCNRDFFPLKFVNINVVNAPILKKYYWDSLDFSGFNKLGLPTTRDFYEVVYMRIPPMPINSPPIKIVIYMLNRKTDVVKWSLKRIQLCDCKIRQIPVGISLSRQVYDCPHRDLLTILPNSGEINSAAVAPIVLNITYRSLGESIVAYELTANDEFKVQLHFVMDIFEFDPSKCVLTKSLLPTCIQTEYDIQPVWFHNPYKHELNLSVSTSDKNLKIIKEKIDILSEAIYPLLVYFTPNRLGEYKLLFTIEFMGIKTNFEIQATATNMFIPVPPQYCPEKDITSHESPFSIYRNYLAITMGTRTSITKMVILHNQSDICVAYNWKCSILEDYYSIGVNPSFGSCKAKHSVSCLIHVQAGSLQCVFVSIPLVCEIRKFTRKNQTNPEADSICFILSSLNDVEMLKENTIITRLFVNVNIRVNALRSLHMSTSKAKSSTEFIAQGPKKLLSRHFDRSILDKLLWSFIFNKQFIQGIIEKKCDRTYEGVPKSPEKAISEKIKGSSVINKSIFVEVVLSLTTQAIDELARKWRFIPGVVVKIS